MNFGKVLLLCILLFALRCMTSLGSGGGETTNGCVFGALVFEDGSHAANTRVLLINSNYNPVEDGTIDEALVDTTDSCGTYHINTPTQGLFNIQAVHFSTGTRVVLQDIMVNNDSVQAPLGTLKKTGMLRVILPKDAPAAGYLYIAGTTFFLPTDTNHDTVDLDSLPIGKIPGVFLGQANAAPRLLANNASVTSSAIAVIDAGIVKTLFIIINAIDRFDYTTSCIMDKDSFLWVGTDGGGLFRFDGVNEWKRFDFPGRTIHCEKIDHNGMHWIGSDTGLYRFDGEAFHQSLIVAGDTIHDDVMSIFIDAANTVWVVTMTRIFKGDGDSWQAVDCQVTGFSDLLVDNSGTVWVGTIANGVIADYGTSRQFYTVSNSLMPSNIVNFLAQDSAGGVWIGTMAGLVRISGSNMFVFTKANGGVAYADVSKGVVAPSGELWYSGDAMNLCNFQKNQTFSAPFLWGKFVTIESVVVDAAGTVWSGSYGGGLVRLENAVQ